MTELFRILVILVSNLFRVSCFVFRISHFEKFALRARILTVCSTEKDGMTLDSNGVDRAAAVHGQTNAGNKIIFHEKYDRVGHVVRASLSFD